LGGAGFKVLSRVSKNQIALRTTALADTGANGHVFCDTKKALEATKHCGARTTRLSNPIPVTNYAGRPSKEITHGITLNLELDGVLYPNTFMLITDCGKHDLLIGFHFFSQHHILLDPANRKLIQQVQETPTFGKILTIQPSRVADLRVQKEHQEDLERRDQLLHAEKYHLPWQIVARPKHKEGINPPLAQGVAEESPPSSNLNIALVGGPAFCWNLKQAGSKFGHCTLVALDAMIIWKHLEEHPLDDEENLRLIQRDLPAEYADFTDVFSKSASDTLAPHREGVDHKIRLNVPESTLTCNHLYKLSEQELQAAKKYIMENLNKGFIVPSKNNPFAFPILFVKKADGGLRMCVDYLRLNEITQKDPYPLPLIDEILPRLLKAKIMTKIDIRQAFHKIRMDPDSEHLTTFRTHYGSFQYKVMPFGLMNGPATFQRYVNHLFVDMLDEFLTAYLDDLLIYSESKKEHIEHV
jgi:hypothetical protein